MDRAGHELTPNERLLAGLAYLAWWIGLLVALFTDADEQPYARYHGVQAVGLGLTLQALAVVILVPLCLAMFLLPLFVELPGYPTFFAALWFTIIAASAVAHWLPLLYFAFAAYTRNCFFTVPLVSAFMATQGWLVRPEIKLIPVGRIDDSRQILLPADRVEDAGNRILAALSYLAWWLAVVVLLVSRDGRRPYSNFHAVQGLALEIALFLISTLGGLLLFPLMLGSLVLGGAFTDSDSSAGAALAAVGILLFMAMLVALTLVPWIYRLYLAGRVIVAGDYFSIPLATRFLVNQKLLDLPGTHGPT